MGAYTFKEISTLIGSTVFIMTHLKGSKVGFNEIKISAKWFSILYVAKLPPLVP